MTNDVDKVRKIPNVDLGVGVERFDSYKGPYGKEMLYVVRHPDLVLPCYVSLAYCSQLLGIIILVFDTCR